jgi:hypothetical protein
VRTREVAVVDGRAARRTVTVGLVEAARAEVLAGPDVTTPIFKTNASTLVDRRPVVITEPEPTTPGRKP